MPPCSRSHCSATFDSRRPERPSEAAFPVSGCTLQTTKCQGGLCDDQARAPAQAGTGATGLSRSTIFALQQRGTFPQSIKFGPKATGWYEDEVQDYIETRPRTGRERAGESR